MILVDTSIWVDHLRAGDHVLTRLLEHDEVLGHPFITGEIALGNLNRPDEVVGLLRHLQAATVASDEEVLHMIRHEALHGIGIGYVDAHLLAGAKLTPPARLWTRDNRLAKASTRLGVAFTPAPQPR